MTQDSDFSAKDLQSVKAAMAARVPERTNAELLAALEAVHARMGVSESSGAEDTANLRITTTVRTRLRRWVSELTIADAERGKSGFGVGNGQLKSWSRYAIGVGALSSCVIAVFAIKYTNPFTQTPESKTYTTTTGQRANITLADGSKVVLAPVTTMRVSGRSVELSGEALFTVNQHTGAPFTVTANSIRTTVLGTEFAVRSYDNSVRVAVRDGKVSTASSVLTAGDVALIRNGKSSVIHNANIAQLLAFSTSTLSFRNTPLRDAIPDMERWFDAEIRLKNPRTGSLLLTGEMATTSVDGLMYALTTTLRLHATRQGRVIILEEI